MPVTELVAQVENESENRAEFSNTARNWQHPLQAQQGTTPDSGDVTPNTCQGYNQDPVNCLRPFSIRAALPSQTQEVDQPM